MVDKYRTVYGISFTADTLPVFYCVSLNKTRSIYNTLHFLTHVGTLTGT